MKNKAFTLIELLAVIVILAIIALIATPIILGIIKDARENAKKRSAELVYTGVEYAYTQSLFKEGSENVVDDVTLETIDKYLNVDNVASHGFESSDTSKEKLHIVTKDNVYCEVTKNTSTKTFEVKCGTDENYTLENVMETKTIAYDVYTAPTLTVTPATAATKTTGNVPAGNYVAGDEYIINIGGEDRVFFILEDGDNTTLTKGTTGTAGPGEVSLIMNMNYTDDKVPVTMAWCDPDGANPENNACNHDNLDPLVSHVQEVFGSNVTVSIPSYDQIYKAAGNKTSGFPTWLYDYLDELSGLSGYWTSSSVASYAILAQNVRFLGKLSDTDVSNAYDNGLRPVITISKSLMN
jgi:prepilin-type N-terminal cleavage/methylation domain-containing protein